MEDLFVKKNNYIKLKTWQHAESTENVCHVLR